MDWQLIYSKRANKDSNRLYSANLHNKAKSILEAIQKDPYVIPPPCEKLIADLAGAFSRRINLKHRLVYKIRHDERIVEILSMFNHYE